MKEIQVRLKDRRDLAGNETGRIRSRGIRNRESKSPKLREGRRRGPEDLDSRGSAIPRLAGVPRANRKARGNFPLAPRCTGTGCATAARSITAAVRHCVAEGRRWVPGGLVDQLVSSGFAETTWKTTCFPGTISATQSALLLIAAEGRYDETRYSSLSSAILIASPISRLMNLSEEFSEEVFSCVLGHNY